MTDTTKKRLILWGSIFGLVTAFGLVSASSVIADRLRAGRGFMWVEPLVTELSGAYSVLPLLPFALWFVRRYPVNRANWAVRVPLHVGASMVFGAFSTLIMWVSRGALWPALGWGAYDYGELRFRIPMEYPKQLMAYGIIYGGVAGFMWTKRTREQEMRAEELERQLVEARLAALKMQLNPHFLFNTLNMISNLIHEAPAKADTMLADLSDFLRLTLSETDAQEVPLEKELRFLNAYLDIMAARFGDALLVDVRVDPDVANALVPQLILQPLVENAIQHCAKEAGRAGRIEVNVTGRAGRLLMSVQDNGPGLAETSQTALSAGVGLSNTAGRLKALYGDDYHLALENAPSGGLHVAIDLPLRAAERDPGGPR
ncbi:MAG: histidine kinase [Gemmatimonadota bacterium]